MALSEREAITHGLELVHEQGDLWRGDRRGTPFHVDFRRGRTALSTPIAGACPEDFSIRRRRPWSPSGIDPGDAELARAAVIRGKDEAVLRGLFGDAELRAKLRALLALGAWVSQGAVHVRSGTELEETRHAVDLAVEVAHELSEALAKVPAADSPAAAPTERYPPSLEEIIRALDLTRTGRDSWGTTRNGVRIDIDSQLELRAYVAGPWPRRFAVHRRKHGKGSESEDPRELVSGSDHAYVEQLVGLPEIRSPLKAVLELPRAWVGEAVVHVRLDRSVDANPLGLPAAIAVPRAADLAVSLADALGRELSRHPPSKRDTAPMRPRARAPAAKHWARPYRTALAILMAALSLALLVGATVSNPTPPIGAPDVGMPRGLHFGMIAIVISWLADLGLLLGSLGRRLFSSNQKLKGTSVGVWAVSWIVSILAVPFLGVLPAVPMICGPLVELLASKPLDSLPPGERAHQSTYTTGGIW